jgi:hypothetical protein
MNMNFTGIRPADEYTKEEQARLQLNTSEKRYAELRNELGITKKEEEQRAKIQSERAKKPKAKPVQRLQSPPLEFNLDYPNMD